MKKVDCIIVGQGIAGTVLATTFLEQNLNIIVVNKSSPNISSRVAAGICNPITGRKWVKTWQADLLFPFLKSFYTSLENKLNTKFFYPLKVYRFFHTVAEQNLWTERVSNQMWQNYMETDVDNETYKDWVKKNELGGWETKQAYHVNLEILLEKFQEYLKEKDIYIEDEINHKTLTFKTNSVIWKNIEASKIIFCEGAHAAKNPFFDWLPFALVKGEILELKFKRNDLKNIINQNMFLMPTSYGTYKVGATYNHKDLTTQTTEEAKQNLLTKLEKFCPLEYEVVGHKAGVRPATKDRRPFIGLHPENNIVGIFGGMGTKGISLSPYFAKHFYENLYEGQTLNNMIKVKRFWKQ